MDNKNEKTFADLFSSSTPESNSKNENLEKNDEENVVTNTQETKPLTFDSLFDKAEKIENEQEEPKEKENLIFSSILEEDNSNLDEKTSSPEIQEEKEQITKIDAFQDIFSQAIVKTEETHEELSKEEKKTEEIKEDKTSFENMNDLFIQTENELEKEEPTEQSTKVDGFQDIFSQATTEQDQSIEKNLPKEDDEIKEDNPLFGVFDATQNEQSISEEEPSNPFFEETTQQETVENSNNQEPTQNENPFFQKEEIVEPSSEENNPFFTKTEPEEEIPKETNLFFTDTTTSEKEEKQLEEHPKNIETKEEPNNQQEEKENDFWEEPKFDKEPKEQESKSISPFFEEEKEQQPENPLFLEKINLIENTENSKKTSNISLKKSKHFNVKIVKKKEPLIKFILGVISYALFIWLLLIGITLLVYVIDIKIRAVKGDYSSPTFNAYVVLTGSMLPEIQVYDVVVTKKVEASELEEGDVITFASADTRFLNTIITHRIIKKNYDNETKKYSFQTQGDNNNVADNALVPQDNIYGKVILKIPKLGYLQEFLASDGGWIIVILIPCLTVISYDIVKLSKGLKKKKYKNIKVQK